MFAKAERRTRRSGQLRTLTPKRYREPTTTSASCERSRRSGRKIGRVGAVGVHRDDAAEALLERPADPVLVRAREAPGRRPPEEVKSRDARPSASTTSAVPSGEASSTTRSETSGRAEKTERTCPSMVSRSWYVGVTTTVDASSSRARGNRLRSKRSGVSTTAAPPQVDSRASRRDLPIGIGRPSKAGEHSPSVWSVERRAARASTDSDRSEDHGDAMSRR